METFDGFAPDEFWDNCWDNWRADYYDRGPYWVPGGAIGLEEEEVPVVNPDHSAFLWWLDDKQPLRHPAEVEPDDTDLGTMLGEWLGETLIWVSDKRSWYKFDLDGGSGAWLAVDDAEALRVSQQFCAALRVHCQIEAWRCSQGEDGAPTEGSAKAWLKESKRYKSVAAQKRLVEASKVSVLHYSREFDPRPDVLNCHGCLVDLVGGNWRETLPKDMCSRTTSVRWYGNEEAFKGSRFERFLKEVTDGDREKEGYLRRALGYSATGTAGDECMFVAYGKTTRNGKGVLFNTVREALGGYGRAPLPDLVTVPKGRVRDTGESASPMRASLRGCRYVTMSEPDKDSQLSAATVKAMTGEDPIMARDLYEKMGDEIKPTFHMWMSCNSLPAVTDMSVFSSRRMKVVTFDRHFTEEEQDTTLKGTLRTEAEQKAVIQWLVQGAREHAAHGLQEPDCVRQASKRWELSSDPVALWLAECTEPCDYLETVSTLFGSFKEWCRDEGFEAGTRTEFSRALKAKGHEQLRTSSRRGYALRIKPQ